MTIEKIREALIISHKREDELNKAMGNNQKVIKTLTRQNLKYAKKISNIMLHRNKLVNQLNP